MDPDSGPVVVIGTYERFLMGFQVPAAQVGRSSERIQQLRERACILNNSILCDAGFLSKDFHFPCS